MAVDYSTKEDEIWILYQVTKDKDGTEKKMQIEIYKTEESAAKWLKFYANTHVKVNDSVGINNPHSMGAEVEAAKYVAYKYRVQP